MQDYFSELLKAIELAPTTSIHHLSQAVTDHKTDPRPFLLLAAEYAQAGRIDMAEAAYIDALQRNPEFAIARFQLGLLQFSTARPAAAFATWAPLSALEQNNPFRLFKTGLECFAQDAFEDAKHWLHQGISNNLDNLPLNQDMQLFIDEISKIQSGQSEHIGNPGNEKSKSDDDKTVSEHFLVSSYRNLY